MDINSVIFYAKAVVGFFLFIIAAYFLLKALGAIAMVILGGIGLIAKGMFEIARFLFKILYVLFMLALIVSTEGYVIYTGLLFLNHEPIHILWTLLGLFVTLLSMNGFFDFIKNGFRFPSEIPSTNPSPIFTSQDWDDSDRREREEHEKYWKDKKQERLDEDRYKAEAAERLQAYYAQKEQERENYNREQEEYRKRTEDNE